MNEGKKKSSSKSGWLTTMIVVAVLVGLAGGLAYLVSIDKGGGPKKQRVDVALVRPDTPQKPLPEPKVQPQETQQAQKVQSIIAPQEMSQAAPGPKGTPADGPLGLEGEGGAGSDGFGLAGRGKGGRDVTTIGGGGGGGGGYDMNAALRKNARYNNRVQDEIDKGVRKCLNENGGIPKGKLEALVKIGMDDGGLVAEHRIIKASGNKIMDDAIAKFLRYAKISEPPPGDIPKGEKGLAIMVVRISLPG
jgi:periplasmic protein TonB